MLKKKKSTVQSCTPPKTKGVGKMITMQQAMDYLSEKGVPCRSRATFYRILEDFGVQFVDINPNGKHKVRRFSTEELNKVLQANGLQE